MFTKRFILFAVLLFTITNTVCGCAKARVKAAPLYTTVEGVEFITEEVSDNLLIKMPRDIYKKYKAAGAENFIKIISKNIETVLQINIDYPQKPVFTFMVLHEGEEFKKMAGGPFESGMAGMRCCPGALAIDEAYFLNFKNTYDIGLIHELAHIMHGMFFELGRISEGFAEIIPFYILGLEDETQKEIIRNLKPEEIYTVAALQKGGMFQDKENSAKRMRAQHRKTYISMYLWMRGYLQALEKQRNIDKIEALNIVLAEFQKAGNMPNSQERNNHIAALIGLSPETVFRSAALQLAARKEIVSLIPKDKIE